jgi:hypothetical protein
MPSTVIEDYVPDDRGWGVVLGRFMQPPPKPDEDDSNDSQPPETEDE